MTLDDFLKWFFAKFMKSIVALLQRVAVLAIFLGALGYFIKSLSTTDLSGIRISPISSQSVNKIIPSENVQTK